MDNLLEEEANAVYWIHRAVHTDMTQEGYIGISNDHERRWDEHRSSNDNPHLARALAKYDDIVFEVICIGNRDYALDIETKLRPEGHIGWNIAAGGGMPPGFSDLSPEKQEEIRAKMSAARSGENNPMYGKSPTAETRKKLSAAVTYEHRAATAARLKANPPEITKPKYDHIGTPVSGVGPVVILRGRKEMKAAGFNPGGIAKCISGKRKKHAGHTWTRTLINEKTKETQEC